jgi:hypothetical protein
MPQSFPFLLRAVCLFIGTTGICSGQSDDLHYSKKVLTDKFYCEGANVGDFNRDRHQDVVAGPYWYAGPDFSRTVKIHEPVAFDPHGYSENFLTFVADLNDDDWDDVIYIPWPGKDCYWYENPGDELGTWKQHLALKAVGNESPAWIDLNGDQRPELVYNIDGQLGYATWDPKLAGKMWKFHAISDLRSTYQRYTHGLGVGDLDGDGKLDILESAGWWQQPESPTKAPWVWHEYKFAEAGAQILVMDVNGDGHQDVLTAWHCHLYGLVWHEQIRSPEGKISFRMHEILSPNPDVTAETLRTSQMHALALADINQDGLLDIVTGKRFWAHGPTGDVEPDASAVVYWYELKRDPQGSVRFVPHRIDDDSGVGTQVTAADLNRDHRPDIIVSNKKGTFLFQSSVGSTLQKN